MRDVFESVKEQAREQCDEHEVIIEVPEDFDVDGEDFSRQVIPFAIGYMSTSHGLTNVGYVDQILVFQRIEDVFQRIEDE